MGAIRTLTTAMIMMGLGLVAFVPNAHAACGATTRTWNGSSTTAFATAANWTAAFVPNTAAQNALIVAGGASPLLSTDTLGCLEITSGVLNATSAVTLTVSGDYFRALTAGFVNFTAGQNVTITMAGAANQTLEVVDPVNNVTISNNQTVTFTNPFTIRNTLTLSGTTTILNVNADLNVTANAFTIPAGVTVNVPAGVTLTAGGGITVNGTLSVAGTGKVVLGSGKTLSVGAAGTVNLVGSAGNLAQLDAAATTFTFTMAGTLNADYFSISHMAATGVNVTGTVTAFQNGDVHNIASAGVAMTVGAAAVVPTTMASVGFYDEVGFGNDFNFNVLVGYGGNTITLNNYAGNLGGPTFVKADPNTKLIWGTPVPTPFVACGTTVRTWNGGTSTSWPLAANWTAANTPDTGAEDANIVSGTFAPLLSTKSVGCMQVSSGTFTASTNLTTLTILGDYFRALNPASLVFTAARTVTIAMAGAANQTLEVVDPINYVTISNNNTVSFTNAFNLRNDLLLTGATSTLNINANLNMSGTNLFTIPAGTTVNVAAGVTLTIAASVTVNGTLTVGAGGKILMATGKTLTVGAGGTLQLNGSSGNLATLDASTGTFIFAMAGTLSADYFYIAHTNSAGLNVTGTVSQLQNGEFHYIASTGDAITVGATAALPTTMASVSFYDDGGFANNFNFNVAAGYTGNTVFLDNYVGEDGGPAYEQADPNSKITWGSALPSPFVACGTTERTWNGGVSTNWAAAANWTLPNVPSTPGEDAIIVSATRIPLLQTMTVGCMEVQSGVLSATTNLTTLTVKGDYFRSLTAGSLTFTAARTIVIDMAGAADQTLEVVDPINYVTISNSHTVTFTDPFNLRNDLLITGTGTVLNINSDLTMTGANIFTIPAGTTVNVGPKATLSVTGGMIVNGTLTIAGGAKVLIASAKTLLVNAGGAVQLNGTSGNHATLDAISGNYTFTMGGTLTANYFAINNTIAATGMNITGTVSQLQNGGFHYIASAGVAITVGATASLPTTMPSIGFFDDSAFNNNFNFSVNAGYAGNTVYLDQYSGNLGGPAHEKTDVNNKVTWGTPAPTQLTLSDGTAAGFPAAAIVANSAALLVATYSFDLSQSDLAADVTQVKLTMYGTATVADINYIKVFRDAAASQNCAYNAGTDVQVGSNITLTGSPPTATVTFATGDVNTDGTKQACFHVLVATSATARQGNTIGFSVEGTGDVTDVRTGGGSYSFGTASAPPVHPGLSTISGAVSSRWTGATSTVWTLTTNWNPATVPTTARDCVIGSGTRVPALLANQACRNSTFSNGGTLNFSSGTWQQQTYGSLTIDSGFTFTNASSGVLALLGSTVQTISGGTAFPGDLLINNSTGADVDVIADTTISGNVTVTKGNLRVLAGATLSIGGNITVQTGAMLTVDPGGTLKLANSKTLTIDSGGTLNLLGNAAHTALVTLTSGASGYSIIVNGTIAARYYTVDHMGIAGLTINSGATIDATNFMQDGSFTFPVVNSTVMLTLNLQVPGNALTNMVFDANGSSATTVTNIKTVAAAGTLTLTTYSGSWSGPTFGNAPTYLESWAGATNTIDITQEATGPTSVNQSQTYNMGRFGFKQTQFGASFADANITTLKLTLTGTGSASDVAAVRIYYDSACTGTGGTLLGTAGTFTGSPATVTFSGLTGAVVEYMPTSSPPPPKRCVYVEFDIAGAAVNANTVGVKLNANGDFVNSQTYAVAAGTPLPITLGTASTIIGNTTTWTGTTDTAWCTATNWTGGVPTGSLNCNISSVTNMPTLTGACTQICKTATINSGTVTMTGTSTWSVYGNFTNNGTFNQGTGILSVDDNGSNPTGQIITTTGGTLGALTFNKVMGGPVTFGSGTYTINTLTMPSGNTHTVKVTNGNTLVLTNGVTIVSGTLQVDGGGTLKIPSGKSISVTGGTFKTAGTNDAWPQTTTNKALITNNGSGTWGFSATSGSVDLTGWLIDKINTTGLVIGGTTTLAHLDGGQFTNLSTSFPTTALQINTSGTIPATASNVGWCWGAANSQYVAGPPLATDNYTLVASTGCASQTISFNQWFGDWWTGVEGVPTPSTKISTVGTCTISIAAANSPVSMSSLSATGYDSAVAVDWTTVSEIDHQGFNVYRSTNPVAGFIQVNPAVIRNINTSISAHGVYRYADANVTNGVTYYYRVEDIAINGARTMHGPVSAMPDPTAGVIPGTPGGTNGGGSSGGADTGNGLAGGPIATPDVIDLGNGAHLLAQTRNSMRVEIVPTAAVYTAATWDATYASIALPGYSNTIAAGSPELVERVLLIEVDDASFATATVTNSTVQEAAVSVHQIQPAPSWSVDGGGVLQPSYSPDAAAYASASYSPAAFFDVDTALKSIGGKKYVQIHVTPLRYKATTQEVRAASKIVLDIGLDGNAWVAPAPSVALSGSPSAVQGTLRIRYKQTGMYQITYDNIATAGLDGFFSGADTTQFRLYVAGQETPLSITSGNGSFASGDKLRFFLPFVATLDDVENEAVLSTVALNGSAAAPLRMQHVDGNPAALTLSNEVGTFTRVVVDHDAPLDTAHPLSYLNDDRPFGSDGLDHIYWARIIGMPGVDPVGDYFSTQTFPADAAFTTHVNLPFLISAAAAPVTMRLTVRARGSVSVNPTHHVAIFVNNVLFPVGDKTFTQQVPTTLNFTIPSTYFAPGVNAVSVLAIGDQVAAGDAEIVDIQKIEFNYRSQLYASNDTLELFSYRPGQAVATDGFSDGSAVIYDVSEPNDVLIVDNAQLSMNGGVFAWLYGTNTGVTGDRGVHYFTAGSAAYLTPTSLKLGRGITASLKSTLQGADLIIIGPRSLLDAASDLVAQRQHEGLRVVTAPLDDIYAEFSNGLKSSQGIRDMLMYAHTSWTAPAPKYVLFIGDATNDPRDRLGFGTNVDVMPVYIESGTYADFAGDNWYVADIDNTGIPTMAVGRLPADTAADVSNYVTKLLAYESGTRAPLANSVTFIADADSAGGGFNEGFLSKATALANGVRALKANITTSTVSRAALGDAATQTAIIDAFGEGPFSLVYVGHGAENMWADAAVFTNQEASALTNTHLPFVMAFNCLNAYFYESDTTAVASYKSLGETLLFNKTGGAVAFWGSTALTNPAVQYTLATNFFNQLAQETAHAFHIVRLGDLTLTAKVALGSSLTTKDALRSYTYLGDPTAKVPPNLFIGDSAVSSGTSSIGGGPAAAGGGGGACGNIRDINGGDSDGSPGAAAEMGTIALFILLGLRYLRRGSQFSRQ